MEPAAIAERLKIISEQLHSINTHLDALNSKTAKAAEWIASTDPVLDSLNERVDLVTDKTEQHDKYIHQEKGGKLALAIAFSQIATAIGMLVALVKLFQGR